MMHNNFEHYQTVGKKLGYDLQQVVDKGDVKVIDPLEDLVESIGRDEEVSVCSLIEECMWTVVLQILGLQFEYRYCKLHLQ